MGMRERWSFVWFDTFAEIRIRSSWRLVVGRVVVWWMGGDASSSGVEVATNGELAFG